MYQPPKNGHNGDWERDRSARTNEEEDCDIAMISIESNDTVRYCRPTATAADHGVD